MTVTRGDSSYAQRRASLGTGGRSWGRAGKGGHAPRCDASTLLRPLPRCSWCGLSHTACLDAFSHQDVMQIRICFRVRMRAICPPPPTDEMHRFEMQRPLISLIDPRLDSKNATTSLRHTFPHLIRRSAGKVRAHSIECIVQQGGSCVFQTHRRRSAKTVRLFAPAISVKPSA